MCHQRLYTNVYAYARDHSGHMPEIQNAPPQCHGSPGKHKKCFAIGKVSTFVVMSPAGNVGCERKRHLLLDACQKKLRRWRTHPEALPAIAALTPVQS